MSENEDRIWDVLIEDALRDSPADAEPQPPGEYTQRLLSPMGPMGVDRGRSMRRTRSRRWLSYLVLAIVIAAIAGLFFAAAKWLSRPEQDNRQSDQPRTNEEAPDTGNTG